MKFLNWDWRKPYFEMYSTLVNEETIYKRQRPLMPNQNERKNIFSFLSFCFFNNFTKLSFCCNSEMQFEKQNNLSSKNFKLLFHIVWVVAQYELKYAKNIFRLLNVFMQEFSIINYFLKKKNSLYQFLHKEFLWTINECVP